MGVPNTFGTATSAIPLSQLDANFNTPITLGNTAIQLGDTVTTLNNMTLANVTISSGNVTITNVAITTANVSGTANISTLVVVGNATVGGNTSVTGNSTVAGSVVLSGGTANGVAYLNVSKVLTTGSVLGFDGTNLLLGTASALTSGKFSLQADLSAVNAMTLRDSGTAYGVSSYYTLYQNSAGSTVGGIGHTAITSLGINATTDLQFFTAATERMRLDASGNLLVGSTVKQTGTAPTFWTNSTTAANGGIGFVPDFEGTGEHSVVSYSAASSTFKGLNFDATTIKFWTGPIASTLERARIDSSGNLGIGTTNIQERLTVQNNIQITNSASNLSGIYFGTNANPAQRYSYIESDGRSTGYINFNTNALERMRIASTGIVTMSAYGVGTATFSAAGVISSVSDETWKIKDGVPVDPDAMLKKLEPGYWYYNDEKKQIFGVDRQLGFYAQNVNAAIGPEAAPTPEEGKPWGYYDRSVLAVTVMSLQKALATIETLTARITALEGA